MPKSDALTARPVDEIMAAIREWVIEGVLADHRESDRPAPSPAPVVRFVRARSATRTPIRPRAVALVAPPVARPPTRSARRAAAAVEAMLEHAEITDPALLLEAPSLASSRDETPSLATEPSTSASSLPSHGSHGAPLDEPAPPSASRPTNASFSPRENEALLRVSSAGVVIRRAARSST